MSKDITDFVPLSSFGCGGIHDDDPKEEQPKDAKKYHHGVFNNIQLNYLSGNHECTICTHTASLHHSRRCRIYQIKALSD